MGPSLESLLMHANWQFVYPVLYGKYGQTGLQNKIINNIEKMNYSDVLKFMTRYNDMDWRFFDTVMNNNDY